MTALTDLAVVSAMVVLAGLGVLVCQLGIYFILRYTKPTIGFHKLPNDKTGDIVFLIRNFDAVRYHSSLRVMLEPLQAIARVHVHAGPHCPDPPVAEPSANRISIEFTKVPADATFSLRVCRKKPHRTVKLHLHPDSELKSRLFAEPLPSHEGFRPVGYFGFRFIAGLAGFVTLLCLGLSFLAGEAQWADWRFIGAALLLALAVFVLVVPTGGKSTIAGYLGWSGASKDWFAEPPPVPPRPTPWPPLPPITEPVDKAQVDILVVLAMAEEHDPYRELGLVHRTDPVDHWRGVVATRSGEQRTIALVVQKEMGGIEAAVLTSRASTLLRPRAIMMSGILGGFSAHVALGDVVIALEAVDYAGGRVGAATAANGAPREQMQPRLSIQKVRASLATRVQGWVTSDRDARGNSSFLAGTRQRLFPVIKTVSESFGSRIHHGAIGSGPLVVASESFMADLQRRFHDKLLGVEMEIHGVMHAGHTAEIPTIAIKAVSDLADAGKNAPNGPDASAARAFAAHASAQLCIQLIRDDVICPPTEERRPLRRSTR